MNKKLIDAEIRMIDAEIQEITGKSYDELLHKQNAMFSLGVDIVFNSTVDPVFGVISGHKALINKFGERIIT